jgi:AcrR family transcriptional regulator
VAVDPEPDVVVRRAPFAENPTVGVRGQQTQQRILDAALKVFGDVGYHQCSIDRITQIAGCSRVSFYQYFSSKEDLFRQLAGQVARQLRASLERLDPITPDAEGWAALRAWVSRYAEIYERYEPVFHAFPAAAESDASLDDASAGIVVRHSAEFRARVADAGLPPRELEPALDLVRETLTRVLGDASTLRTAIGDALPLDTILDAYTDVVHRSLFGRIDGVNVHEPAVGRLPKLPFGPVMQAAFEQDAAPEEAKATGRARTALLEAARPVFAARGFHATRVDDIVEAAGVSHGAFYRYFKNKEELAHLLAAQAMRTVSNSFTDMPDLTSDQPAARSALRRWLRDYSRAQAGETAMFRVWVDAALQDAALKIDSASVLDWGRRRMAHALDGREFGNADVDAVVLVSLLDAFGVRERPARTVDAAVSIIERGFLGR